MELSRQEQLPIIFITNDIKKNEDWCYLDPSSPKEDRILMPREELIKEMKDYPKVDFWMYDFPQFLYRVKKYLKAEISKESIENITQLVEKHGFPTKEKIGGLNSNGNLGSGQKIIYAAYWNNFFAHFHKAVKMRLLF